MRDVKNQYIRYLDSAEGADKYNEFKRILYGKDDSLVLQLFRIIISKFAGRKELSILDVGGGDGKRLMHLMDLFEKKGIASRAVLTEPSKTFTDNCRQEAKRQKRNIVVHRQTFEKFYTTEKFDLIIFIHSIYTFRDALYLKRAKAMLKKGGLLVIVANGRNSFLGGLKKITDWEYKSGRNEINSLTTQLAQLKYGYDIKKFNTKFSGVLAGQKLNGYGRLILEWLAMRKISDINPIMQKKATEYFVKKHKRGYITEQEVVLLLEK